MGCVWDSINGCGGAESDFRYGPSCMITLRKYCRGDLLPAAKTSDLTRKEEKHGSSGTLRPRHPASSNEKGIADHRALHTIYRDVDADLRPPLLGCLG